MFKSRCHSVGHSSSLTSKEINGRSPRVSAYYKEPRLAMKDWILSTSCHQGGRHSTGSTLSSESSNVARGWREIFFSGVTTGEVLMLLSMNLPPMLL